MKKREIVLFVVLAAYLQGVAIGQEKASPGAESPTQPFTQKTDGRQYSGMYAFLKDGEFVQLTVEDDGRVTGFISHYAEGDNGAFVDLFFKSGALKDNQLTFTTKAVQGVSFDFKGTAVRGAGKDPGDEAYYVLKGTLTENLTGADKKVTSNAREVELKGFPQEAGADGKK